MYSTSLKRIEQQLKNLKHKVTCGVQFFDSFEDFPETGKDCAVYVDKTTGAFYVWNGTSYVSCCEGAGGGVQGVQGLTGLQGVQGSAGYSGLTYGSFYDVTDQTVTTNQVAPMEFGSTDFSNGISIVNDLSANPSLITLSATGKYNIQFSAQLYRESGGSAANARIWLRKNGTNVPDTTTIVHFGNNNIYSVAAWNFFVNASSGDQYQIMWSQDASIIMLHEPANLVIPCPAIPSVILTVNQIA